MTLKKGKILDMIKTANFLKSKEPTRIYRLGLIRKTTYDLVELFPGIHYPPHFHKKAKGYLLFIQGKGMFILKDKERSYKPGDYVSLGKGVKHGFKPKTPTLILSIQTPPVKNPKTRKEDIEF